MKCSRCGRPVDRQKGFEIGGTFLCSECFITKAQERRELTKEDRERLKRAVLEETASPINRSLLKGILEDGLVRLGQGEDEDDVVEDMVNQIERLAAFFISREILGVIEACQKVFLEQEEEIRTRIRKLASL